MQAFLLDEGVPPVIAAALRTLELTAHAVGEADAPPRKSTDHVNAAWCAKHGAVLVTNDRGKKDRAIFDALAQHHVHALFVHDELLAALPHQLMHALLAAEHKIDASCARKKGLLRARLRPRGGLERR